MQSILTDQKHLLAVNNMKLIGLQGADLMVIEQLQIECFLLILQEYVYCSFTEVVKYQFTTKSGLHNNFRIVTWHSSIANWAVYVYTMVRSVNLVWFLVIYAGYVYRGMSFYFSSFMFLNLYNK